MTTYFLIACGTLMMSVIFAIHSFLVRDWWYFGAALIMLIPCVAVLVLASKVRNDAKD
jgi:hypothetical protein